MDNSLIESLRVAVLTKIEHDNAKHGIESLGGGDWETAGEPYRQRLADADSAATAALEKFVNDRIAAAVRA